MTHFSRRKPAFMLLLSFFVVRSHWWGYRSRLGQSIAHRDGTFIDKIRALNQPMRRGVVACSDEQVPSSYHLRVDFWMVGSAVGSTNMGTDSDF
ncbi:hypothetical protein BGY98DRAFT_1002869 [Russula aff. rugulosa BPL654]|nr:hypothetical protein BGY98DRAFT_1002869 [Russula aff. rugulosa BPL654]